MEDFFWIILLIVAGLGGAVKRATEQGQRNRRPPMRGPYGRPLRPLAPETEQMEPVEEPVSAPEVPLLADAPPVQAEPPAPTSEPRWRQQLVEAAAVELNEDQAGRMAPALASWLQDPRTMQQAVIASEVLGRPRALRGQRWGR